MKEDECGWCASFGQSTEMVKGQKIVVVMPAYNAARTLQRTYDEVMAQGIVDLVIVVDDASHDETVAIARTLKRRAVEVHPENRGYGGNQKTCYRLALAAGADIVVMIHPDYQYTPQLLRRWLPWSRAVFIRVCSPRAFSAAVHSMAGCHGGNMLRTVPHLRRKFSDRRQAFRISTGYRAFARILLERVPIEHNSDDFVFDNQMLAKYLLAQKSERSPARRNICPKDLD